MNEAPEVLAFIQKRNLRGFAVSMAEVRERFYHDSPDAAPLRLMIGRLMDNRWIKDVRGGVVLGEMGFFVTANGRARLKWEREQRKGQGQLFPG